MSIASLFAELGAPLKNREWSRGGISRVDGSVFLMVWQDQIRRREGSSWVNLGLSGLTPGTGNAATIEREAHIKRLKAGDRGFVIFCEPRWPNSSEREIATYNADQVFPTGDIVTRDGSVWAQYLTGIRVRELLFPSR